MTKPVRTQNLLKNGAGLLASVAAAFFVFGCMAPRNIGYDSSTANSGTTHKTSTDILSDYKGAQAVKVVFNRSNFYNNYSPNPNGCGGDAKYYYDAASDRRVPVKPDWLVNVAVELTNSSASTASNATACSYIGTKDPSTCASFDDFQPLNGDASKTFVTGGVSCVDNSGSCNQVIATDRSVLTVPADVTGASWAATSVSTQQRAWAAGDIDQLHRELYLYGGLSGSAGAFTFAPGVLKTTFNDDGSVAAESVLTPAVTSYGNWLKSGATPVVGTAPNALLGSTFTFSTHRDPTMKTNCLKGDSAVGCFGASNGTVTALNEHSDYFLLVGGVYQTGGHLKIDKSALHIYKPHAFSNDTAVTPSPSGEWLQLMNSDANHKIMSVSEIDYQSTTQDFRVVPAPAATPSAVGWNGRAFHRTVYDPAMNRFYIFGGIEESSVDTLDVAPPNLADPYVWVFDPPAVGRRPTSACYTKVMPDGSALPSSAAAPTSAIGGSLGLGPNRNYLGSNYVFPPGGCLQKMALDFDNSPDARFEHAMAFDRDQHAVVLFGGCSTTNVMQNVVAGSLRAGDPTSLCNPSTLMNDMWLYIPPVVTEYVQKDYSGATGTPYDPIAANRFPNIFSIDFWLDHLPLFLGTNTPPEGSLTRPAQYQAMGTWISLRSTTSTSTATVPSPRAGAGFSYDRAHHKFYLQGGYGCLNTNASGYCTDSAAQDLNDLWEYTPPKIERDCDVVTAQCASLGTWRLVKAHTNDTADTSQPKIRRGAIMTYLESTPATGDEYYTVTDAACVNQGPWAGSGQPAKSKQEVGAIYINLDRSTIAGTTQGILINLRYLPFDRNTKLPGLATVSYVNTDTATSADTAQIRVQLLRDTNTVIDRIWPLWQPRFPSYALSSVATSDFMTVSSGTGQITERQIWIPLGSLDPDINLIRIQRLEGSAKFYEMTISRF